MIAWRWWWIIEGKGVLVYLVWMCKGNEAAREAVGRGFSVLRTFFVIGG